MVAMENLQQNESESQNNVVQKKFRAILPKISSSSDIHGPVKEMFGYLKLKENNDLILATFKSKKDVHDGEVNIPIPNQFSVVRNTDRREQRDTSDESTESSSCQVVHPTTAQQEDKPDFSTRSPLLKSYVRLTINPRAQVNDSPVPGETVITNSCSLEKRKRQLTSKAQSYMEHAGNVNAEIEKSADDYNEEVCGKRRRAITLEVKVNIIKRVNSGDNKSDVADDYGISISTIKSICKKSDFYLKCWKNGECNRKIKCMKGAKREDLDDVIYYWYSQAKKDAMPVSGALLCSKAMEFAIRLGYKDFKASNGWLNRFKKRKGITFERPSAKKTAENAAMVPQISEFLLYEDPSNVFSLQETGVLYRTMPSDPHCMEKERCSGGIRAHQRLSVLMCTNMAATEKFPLLIAGSIPKRQYKSLVKNSPVQYVYDERSWFTKECIFAWLLDLDHWFSIHKRKVTFILANLPIHDNFPVNSFSAITLHVLPPNGLHPLKHTVLRTFKLNYRQSLLLEYNKTKVSLRQRQPQHNIHSKVNEPRFDLSFYIRLLAKAWQDVSEVDIRTSFQKAGLGCYTNWAHTNDLHTMTHPELLQEYKNNRPATSSTLSFMEYIHFDDEVQVCDEHNINDIIAKLNKNNDIQCDDEANYNSTGETNEQQSKQLESIRALENYAKTCDDYLEINAALQHLKLLVQKIT